MRSSGLCYGLPTRLEQDKSRVSNYEYRSRFMILGRFDPKIIVIERGNAHYQWAKFDGGFGPW